ncbi:MAG: Hpt domain-containing protein [Hyphomonadaceae bacterium]|nr:Hpt domain-containing protein [Hyphomonadaceae bacterium]
MTGFSHSSTPGPEGAGPPVIDRAHLDRMTGGDGELALEVLDLFGEQIAMWQRLLSPSSENADWLVGVHTIKGSARGIGAWDLAEACGAAEDAARDTTLTRDDRRHWAEVINRCLDTVALAIAGIRHELAIRSLRA